VEEIIVSCDSTSEKGFEKIRGNSFRQLEKGIYALNRAKKKYESILPRLVLEFVAMKGNIHELKELPGLASRWEAISLLVTNLLPYSKDMTGEILYISPVTNNLAVDIASIVWEATAKKWFTWGTIKLPRMAWGAVRQCRFIDSYSAVVTWDGDVVPCYPLSHSYTYFIFDRCKEVKKYSFGNLKNSSLYSIWTSKEYVRFRGKVRLFRFPSCVDCELAYTCDYPANNSDCWGNEPSCADCLWAQNIIQCP
jgi:radical SAM protein with 4Fe4S-binding SPASM domain